MNRGNEQFDLSHTAPDLTRKIMGRLGYMRVSEEIARKHRRKKWAGRGMILAGLAAALFAGYRVYEASDSVRKPAEVTVPAALINNVSEQQQKFQNMFDVIRDRSRTLELSPAVPVQQPEKGVEPNVDDVRDSVETGQRWV